MGHLEPTSPSNEELPRRRLEAMGFSRAHLSLVCGLALFLLDFFSGGLFIHMWRCLISRCLLLGQKGVIALHFHLNPALIEI